MANVRRFKTSYRRLSLRLKLFDTAFYRRRYPDVAAAGMHPFVHYLLHGAAEGRKPNRWFDPDYYLARSAEARKRGGDPFLDYLDHGRREGASPHPLRDGRVQDGRAGPALEGSLFGCDS
jgi:hypothetical protein